MEGDSNAREGLFPRKRVLRREGEGCCDDGKGPSTGTPSSPLSPTWERRTMREPEEEAESFDGTAASSDRREYAKDWFAVGTSRCRA